LQAQKFLLKIISLSRFAIQTKILFINETTVEEPEKEKHVESLDKVVIAANKITKYIKIYVLPVILVSSIINNICYFLL
jgi:hypothetical protein